MTQFEAAELLGVNKNIIRKLRHVGLLDPAGIGTRGAALDVPERSAPGVLGLDRLLAAEPVTPQETLFVVSLGRPDDPSVPSHGSWHETWSDADKMAAAEKWWRLSIQGRDQPIALVAVVGQWVVGAWRIEGEQGRPGGDKNQRRYDLAPDAALLARYQYKRVALTPRAMHAVLHPAQDRAGLSA